MNIQISERRTCGGCTACCLTHPIYELNKPPGEQCPHCTEGQGCKIYRRRPKGCQDFQCRWLLGEGKRGERPDKTGLVMDFFDLPVIGPTYAIFEAVRGALENEIVSRKTQEYLGRGLSVCHLPLAGDNTLFLPQMPEAIVRRMERIEPRVNGKRCNIIYRRSDV